MAIKVEGTRSFSTRLKKLSRKTRETKNARVVVGFAMPYALYVHEGAQGRSPVKFLEGPSRNLKDQLGAEIKKEVKAGRTLLQALKSTGQALLNIAIALAPIDTGALRASGFVASARTADREADKARRRGERIRRTALRRRRT